MKKVQLSFILELFISLAVLTAGYMPILYADNNWVTGLGYQYGSLFYISYFDILRSAYLPLFALSIFLLIISLLNLTKDIIPYEVFLIADSLYVFALLNLISSIGIIPSIIHETLNAPGLVITSNIETSRTILGRLFLYGNTSPLFFIAVLTTTVRLVTTLERTPD